MRPVFHGGSQDRRFLDCSLKLYDVPQAKRECIIEAILCMDLHSMAEGIIQKTIQQAEAGFEALIAETE